jgi:hypothetical protein
MYVQDAILLFQGALQASASLLSLPSFRTRILTENGGAGKKLLRIMSRYAEQENLTKGPEDSLSPQNPKTPATTSTDASGLPPTAGARVERDPITGEKLNRKKGELAVLYGQARAGRSTCVQRLPWSLPSKTICCKVQGLACHDKRCSLERIFSKTHLQPKPCRVRTSRFLVSNSTAATCACRVSCSN